MQGVDLIAFPHRPDDRMRLALRRLDEALEEQRTAVAAWRAEIGLLAGATRGLDDSLQEFRHGLGDLAGAARQAQEEAARLERTAEAMAAVPGGR